VLVAVGGFFTDGSIAEDLALVAVDSSSLTGRFSKCEHVEDTCREVFMWLGGFRSSELLKVIYYSKILAR
jgi:hypothetical protein